MLRPDPSFPTQINVKGHRWSVTQRGCIGGLKCSESDELDGAVVGTSFEGAEVGSRSWKRSAGLFRRPYVVECFGERVDSLDWKPLLWMVTLTEKPDKAIGVVRVRHTLNYGEVKIDLSSRPPLPGQDVLCFVVCCSILFCSCLWR
jgi:hypothetical protein